VAEAEFPKGIEEEPSEQSQANPQFQYQEFVFQVACLIGGGKVSEKEVGRVPGENTAIIDGEGDGDGVTEKGAAAALKEVGCSEVPLQAIGQGSKVLEGETASLGTGKDIGGGSNRGATKRRRLTLARVKGGIFPGWVCGHGFPPGMLSIGLCI
jgi:hypothetical protein